jgi:hypothetical protein
MSMAHSAPLLTDKARVVDERNAPDFLLGGVDMRVSGIVE